MSSTKQIDVTIQHPLKADAAFILYQFGDLPFRLGFVLYWLATALLLRNYSKVLGKTKFWTLISLPIVSFFAAKLFLFGVIKQTSLFPSLLSYSSATIGTIIFALTLLTLAKNMAQIHNKRVANYLTIAAYGIVLFFEAVAFPVIHTPYPPFSAVCWSFAGLGVFLYTLGIYFSAISISHDAKLRLSIRQFTATQSRLLDNIGTAQMEEAIQNRVTKIVKEQEEVLKEQTGIQQVPNEEDIKFYIEEVIQEIKKNRKQE